MSYWKAIVARIASGRRTVASSIGAGPSATAWLESLVRDVVVGWRSLRRRAGATSVIVISLALVLGANTAIFSLADAMYLRRLDLPDPSQLVRVDALRNGRVESLSYTRFQRLRSAPDLPKLSAFRFEGVEAMTPSGETQRLWLDLVTGDYFHLIGITPLIGRTIDAQDEASAAEVVVVSEDYWRQHLGARADVLDQTLRLNDRLFTIVGVMPSRYRGLHFAHRFAMAAPFTVSPAGFSNRGILSTTIVARLNGAIDRRAQRAALETVIRGCCVDDVNADPGATARGELQFVPVDDPPSHSEPGPTKGGAVGVTVELTDASRGLSWSRDFRARYKGAIVGVVSGVLLLLLIACANVATLLLVRGESRAREFAVRRSLGASVGRVRRQLFVEALELCLLGAVVGLPIAWAGTMLLSHALPPSARALGEVIAWRMDTRIVAMTLVITALCAVATSLWPARRLGRDELLGALTGARARVSDGLTSQRLLVISQIALSMILITVAWLFVATTHQLTESAAGYGSRDILLAHISVDRPVDSATEKTATFDAVRDGLGRIAGIRSAAYAFDAPLMQDGLMQLVVEPAGWTAEPVTARRNLVSGGFFTAIGSPMTRGRAFMASDDAQAEPVAIVSESFERRYYGARSAVGSTLLLPDASPPKRVRVVGIARNVHYDRMQTTVDLRNPESEMVYLPFAQSQSVRTATMIIQPAVAPAIVMTSVRRALEQRGVRVSRITSVGELLDDGASRERFSATLATGFGILAVLLALTGVLGVLSFQVARRTKEIGVRMALGAQRQDAVGLVFKQTLGMVAAALLVGIPAAGSAAWLVRSQLFGVAPWDLRAILTAAAAIMTAGAVASLVPSYRAATVDPMIALRED